MEEEAQVGNEWPNILAKSSQARKKSPPPPPPPPSSYFICFSHARHLFRVLAHSGDVQTTLEAISVQFHYVIIVISNYVSMRLSFVKVSSSENVRIAASSLNSTKNNLKFEPFDFIDPISLQTNRWWGLSVI